MTEILTGGYMNMGIYVGTYYLEYLLTPKRLNLADKSIISLVTIYDHYLA